MKHLCYSVLFVGLLWALPLEGIIGGVPSLTPAQKAIHDAASIKDPQTQQDALSHAIRDGLLSQDRSIREDVFKYVAENVRWIDLRPYASILEAYNKIDEHHDRALELLDRSELMYAPRQEREELYRRAIVEGSVRLSHSLTVTRPVALSIACLEGIDELTPLIRQHLQEARPDEQERLLPTLELRAGGADREDAARLAAGRLAGIPETEFCSRMENESGFRAAVLRVAQDACAAHPFSHLRNPGCADMKRVIGWQMALDQERRKDTAKAATLSARAAGEETKEDWLEALKYFVPDAEAVNPKR